MRDHLINSHRDLRIFMHDTRSCIKHCMLHRMLSLFWRIVNLKSESIKLQMYRKICGQLELKKIDVDKNLHLNHKLLDSLIKLRKYLKKYVWI